MKINTLTSLSLVGGEALTIGWRTITNVITMSVTIRQYYTAQYIMLQGQRQLITASATTLLLQHNLINLGCLRRPSLSRYHSSDSSSSTSKQLSKNDSTATSSNQINHEKQVYKKRRRKRSISSYSLLQQQYKHLPQTTNENRLLTRRELIRLSPKQRTIYHAKRLQHYKESQTYLDQARTNVRSNIKFLSETADTNFKKNISTIKRLFNGEEVDSVIAEQPKITSATNKSAKRQQKLKSKEEEESLTNGIDWERAPTEIKANFQSNIASLQNWLHQVSDGKIPSSTYINSSSTSVEHPTGSVANRISKFHQLKQSNKLVMDNKWIFKNILLALLPGTLFHLYFRSLQGEMREYYDRVEQDERDKILGYRDEAGVVDAPSGSDDDESSSTTNVDIGSKESDSSSSGKMGLSSAFSITEGENAWEKLKIVVSDLFLGGVEEKISRHRSKQQKQENGEQDDAVVETTNNQPTPSVLPSAVSEKSPIPADSPSTSPNKDLDPTIQTLLHRIEALEQQLGTTSNSTKLKEDLHKKQEQQHQRQKEHQLKRRIERLRQSPIQNRREDKLEAEWREEEANKKKSKVHAQNNIQDEDDESSSSSFSLWDVTNFMIEASIGSIQISLKQKIKEVFDTYLVESGEASIDEEQDASNIISSTDPTLDSTEQPIEADVVSTVVSAGDSDLTNTGSTTPNNGIQQESNPDPSTSTSCSGGGLRRWIGKLWRRRHSTPTPDM